VNATGDSRGQADWMKSPTSHSGWGHRHTRVQSRPRSPTSEPAWRGPFIPPPEVGYRQNPGDLGRLATGRRSTHAVAPDFPYRRRYNRCGSVPDQRPGTAGRNGEPVARWKSDRDWLLPRPSMRLCV